ncbi:hypothetical protein L2E82_43960 [Cichorium intybus]|uniref:Uncharacterized protein n=1 Tax=Cichorium intybus TaxID=13427 RepID=A0ACB8ZPI4_CICIN|nr:hypothetical protein L2E82_43960 [Cichorium intybus]
MSKLPLCGSPHATIETLLYFICFVHHRKRRSPRTRYICDKVKENEKNELEKVDIKLGNLKKLLEEKIKDANMNVDAKFDYIVTTLNFDHSIVQAQLFALTTSINKLYKQSAEAVNVTEASLREQIEEATEKIKELELKAHAHDLHKMAQTTL